MKAASLSENTPWIWASVTGVVALVGLAFFVRVPGPLSAPPQTTAPTLQLVDRVVIPGTMLRDPTPLFLPTEFNSSRRDYVPIEPAGAFVGYAPKWTFGDSELALNLPAPVAIPASPAEALRGEPIGSPFLGFDRSDPVMEPVGARGAYIEIVEAGSGRTVFGMSVADAHPPAAARPWQPMEFMAAVDAAGLIGSVIPTTRSGVDEVDAYFSQYLTEKLKVGQRLLPGFYRIGVGP